jgi:hypothetical protein
MANGNIRQVEAGDGGLQTTNAVSNAFEGTARTQAIALGEAGSAISSSLRLAGNVGQDIYDKTIVQSEISTGAATFATLNDNLNTQWNTLAKDSDPNDGTIAGKFRDGTMEPELEKFVDSFQTEKGKLWAQGQVDNLRQHYYEKTAADTATRSASAIGQNLDITTNRLAASATDPHSLDLALGVYSDSVNALIENSPALTGTTAADVQTRLLQQGREQIIQTGLMNMAKANPTAFIDALDAGDFSGYMGDLTGVDVKTLHSYAEAQLSAQDSDAKALKTAQDKADKDAADKAVVSLIGSGLQPDGTLQLPPNFNSTLLNDIAVMPGADREMITATLSAGRAIASDAASGKVAQDVPEVYMDFNTRAFLPPGNPNRLSLTEVLQARGNGQLSDKSFSFFKEAVGNDEQDPGKVANNNYFNAFLTTYQPAINPTGNQSSFETQRYYQFQVDMRRNFEIGLSNGIPANQLLDPASPNFILGKNGSGLMQYTLAGAATGGMATGITGAGPIVPVVTQPIFPSAASSNENLTDFMTQFYGGAPSPAIVPPGPAPVQTYKPGMSMDELAKLVQ